MVARGDVGDDRAVTPEALARLLTEPVVVEEKLDGANVSIWLDASGWPQVTSRSGKAHGDRGGQLGRVNAWVGERAEALRSLLGDGSEVAYGEWLARTHSVEYDALPDWLVILDIWDPDRGYASTAERDRRAHAAGLATPPVLFRGRLGSLAALTALHDQSCVGSGPAEGLVVRIERNGRLDARAKWLSPDFIRKTDAAWKTDTRMNRLRSDR